MGRLRSHLRGGAVSDDDRVQGEAMAVGGEVVKKPGHQGAEGLRATCPSLHYWGGAPIKLRPRDSVSE